MARQTGLPLRLHGMGMISPQLMIDLGKFRTGTSHITVNKTRNYIQLVRNNISRSCTFSKDAILRVTRLSDGQHEQSVDCTVHDTIQSGRSTGGKGYPRGHSLKTAHYIWLASARCCSCSLGVAELGTTARQCIDGLGDQLCKYTANLSNMLPAEEAKLNDRMTL